MDWGRVKDVFGEVLDADSTSRAAVLDRACAGDRPAQRSKIETGDVVAAVNGTNADSLADLFRKIWSMGEAGVDVPLTMLREGKTFEVTVKSADRHSFLKAPRLH